MITAKRMMLILVLFVGLIQVGDSQELGEIHDAVFSPDGTKIGVGTETGFYIYDRASFECEFALPTPDAVYFIRWSPNDEKVFLALWNPLAQEGRNPFDWKIETVYWVYDINQHNLLTELHEDIRWFFSYQRRIDFGYTSYNISSINFPERRCAHPNSVRFSPDGNRLVWMTMENQVKELDMRTNEIRIIIPSFQDEEYIISIGYLNINMPDVLWINALENKVLDSLTYHLPHSTSLMFFQEIDGKYQRRHEEQLNYVIFDIFENGLWGILLLPYPPSHSLTVYFRRTMRHSLYSITSRKVVDLTPGDDNGGHFGEEYRIRSAFDRNGDRINILLYSYISDQPYHFFRSREYSISSLKILKETPWISIPDPGLGVYLLQPFSPDGEEFLHIRDGKLYIYTTDTFEGEVVLPKPAGVSGSEWLK